MKTSYLILVAAVVDGILGLALLFFPEDTMALMLGAGAVGTERTGQLAATAIFAIAGLNWFNRTARIGGIYGRPIVIPNLFHKMTLALLLVGDAVRGSIPPAGVGLTVVYGLLAMAFAVVMRGRSPVD